MSRDGYRRKDVPADVAAELREALIAEDLGVSKPAVGATWRLRIGDTDLGYWKSRGTLYGSRSRSDDPRVSEAWRLIASRTKKPFVEPSRPILVGLDESGTTEPVGPPFMVAAILPAALAPQVWDVIELADTKRKRHSPSYWDGLVDELQPLQEAGLDFFVADVPTTRCEDQGAKPLLDAVYREILADVFAVRQPVDSRVVIDNYGVGPVLCQTLRELHEGGAEVIPSPVRGCSREEGTHADDDYVEVRAASVMARYHRERFLATVPPDVPLGTTNAEFRAWLQDLRSKDDTMPAFLKRWVSTVS